MRGFCVIVGTSSDCQHLRCHATPGNQKGRVIVKRTALLALGVIFALGCCLTISPTSCLGDEPPMNIPPQSWAFLPGIGKVTVINFEAGDDGVYLVTSTGRIRVIPKSVTPEPPARGESSYWSWLIPQMLQRQHEHGSPTFAQIRRSVTDTLRANGAPHFDSVLVLDETCLNVYWHDTQRPERFIIALGKPTPDDILQRDLETLLMLQRTGKAFIFAPNAPGYPNIADSLAVERDVMRLDAIRSLGAAQREQQLFSWRGEHLTIGQARRFLNPPEWVRKSR